MIFTEELKRRLGMKTEDVTKGADKFFIDTHKELAAEVEKVFLQYIKDGLSPEIITHEAWQTAGWFQEYMEYGGFCLPGGRVKITENRRTLSHIHRVKRRDLNAAAITFEKALDMVLKITRDPGAWEEFQRSSPKAAVRVVFPVR